MGNFRKKNRNVGIIWYQPVTQQNSLTNNHKTHRLYITSRFFYAPVISDKDRSIMNLLCLVPFSMLSTHYTEGSLHYVYNYIKQTVPKRSCDLRGPNRKLM